MKYATNSTPLVNARYATVYPKMTKAAHPAVATTLLFTMNCVSVIFRYIDGRSRIMTAPHMQLRKAAEINMYALCMSFRGSRHRRLHNNRSTSSHDEAAVNVVRGRAKPVTAIGIPNSTTRINSSR
jgi:hypothetical protein